jgi:hypothetical protein
VVEHLPRKCEAPSSNPNAEKQNKTKNLYTTTINNKKELEIGCILQSGVWARNDKGMEKAMVVSKEQKRQVCELINLEVTDFVDGVGKERKR